MKTFIKTIIFSLVNICFIIFPVQMTQSCSYAEFEDEDYRVAFFNTKMLDNEKMDAFYFTTELWNSWETNKDDDYFQNCKEWQKQLGNGVDVKDIYDVLYKSETDKVYKAYQKKRLKRAFPNNSFIKAIQKSKNKDLLDYWSFVMFIELNASYEYDLWEVLDRDEIDDFDEEKIISKRIHKVSPFLKERYAYQLIIAHRYDGKYQKCIDVFEKYLSNSKSILKPWAYTHVAYSHYELEQFGESNLALARAFDGCELRKKRVVLGFLKEHLEDALAIAETNRDKAALLTVANLHFPGRSLRAIKEIIEVEPNYPHLNLMITREINKVENWLYAPYLLSQISVLDINWDEKNDTYENYYQYFYHRWSAENPSNFDINNQNYTHKNYEKDLIYLNEFRAALEKLVQLDMSKKNKDFLQLAIAHMCFLDFQPQEASLELKKLSKGLEPAVQAQVHIEKLLLTPQFEDITTAKTQSKLFESLNWLKDHSKAFQKPLRTLAQLHIYLSRAFYRKGDMVTAGLLQTQTIGTVKGGGGNSGYYSSIAFWDKYGSIKDVEETLVFLNKKGKTPFEQYLMSNMKVTNESFWANDYSDNDIPRTPPPPPFRNETQMKKQIPSISQDLKYRLYDLQGTLAFRQDKLEIAIKYYSKLPKNYWKEVYAFEYFLDNPFEDNRKSEYRAEKLKIAKRMLQLKKENSPKSLLLLGSAYAACTYHGETWMMFAYGKYPDEWNVNNRSLDYNFQPNATSYEDVYYRMERAIQTFKAVTCHPKATLEQKGEAYLMMGKFDKTANYWATKEKTGDYGSYDYVSIYDVKVQNNFKEAKNYNYLMSCLSSRY